MGEVTLALEWHGDELDILSIHTHEVKAREAALRECSSSPVGRVAKDFEWREYGDDWELWYYGKPTNRHAFLQDLHWMMTGFSVRTLPVEE